MRAYHSFRGGRWQLSWSSLRYEPLGLTDPDDEDQAEHDDESLRASLTLGVGERTDLSLYATRRFTDDGDADILGFELRRSF